MPQSSIYDSIVGLPALCNPVFDKACHSSFFMCRGWYENLALTAIPENTHPRVYVAGDTGAVRGILLMKHSGTQGLFKPRKLEALANFYTSLFGPVLDYSDHENIDNTINALITAMVSDPKKWDVIDMHPMAYDTPIFAKMAAMLTKAGMIVHTYYCFGNWYLALQGRSYQDYLGALPSKIRNTLKRKARKLNKEHQAHIEIITGARGLDAKIADFNNIYSSSWKTPEPFPAFIPGLIRLCAEKGWLRLGLIYIDGKPIAGQIWIVQGGTAAIYKLAYNERYAQLSAGSLLTAKLMEHVIDVDRVREVDYLTGDDAYKKDWMSHRRERWGIIAMNPRTPHGLITATGHTLRRTVKKALKPLINSRHPPAR